jgi:DNA repair protein RecO (recombination protein O)
MSTRERLYRTRAVVLSRRDYNEADRILTVFTPELGKRELMAKGVRKTTSHKAGHVELMMYTLLLVAQARTWDIIAEAVTVESFRHLRENLEAIACASYVCELVSCFTEADDESQPLWELLLFTLRMLDEYSQSAPQFDLALLLRWFDLQLLG